MSADDQFVWLEETRGARALTWVRHQNERTLQRLTREPRYHRLREVALAVARDDSRIPSSGWMHRGRIYNFWQDDKHPRGILRYTSLESFRTGSPDWKLLLDIDRLAHQESRRWSFEFGIRFAPGDTTRCLISLSDGGAGAAVTWREFDLERGTLVRDGFVVPEAKNAFVSWKNDDTLLVASNFGPGTVTPSGFPMIVKEWSRGETLSEAREIFRAPSSQQGDAAATMVWDLTDDTGRRIVGVGDDAMGSQRFWLFDDDGRLSPSLLPPYVANQFVVHRGHLLVIPQQDWVVRGRTWTAGSLLSVPIEEIVRREPSVRLVFRPTPREAISSIRITHAGVLVYGADNVRGRLWHVRLENDRWSAREEVALPDNGTINDVMSDAASPIAFASYESVLHPPALYELHVPSGRAVVRFAQRAQFSTVGYVTEQLEATSTDGTRIPFFVTRAKHAPFDGTQPTLLYGYGAFFGAQYPRYSGALGRLWLDEGGTYVLANIRGGVEFGPAWHVAGPARARTYEDFVAVAQELIRRKITSSRHLGAYGVSAGGLLVGVMLTQHPELFSAAIPKVPVLDLLRPDLIYAPGAAMAEFGSPDIEVERAFLMSTSPYQNLDRYKKAFPAFIITSTTDDQVHPSQARKFAARMESFGMPFLFYETEEGGHAAANTPEARATLDALEYTYLAQQLMPAE